MNRALMFTDSPPVLAIVGPTASGKSALAMALAEKHGGEIVSCDSVQVYRGLSIGCAKPTAEEQRRVPHHLIDVVAPQEPFDAAAYVRHARAALAAIRQRGARPILCGGTGLYLRALRWGLIELPPVDPALRQSLEQSDPNELRQRLRQLDPVSAQQIELNNLVQVVRALEITLQTGEPASAVRARHGFRQQQVPMRVVVLAPPRDALRAAIRARVDTMLAAGWREEVRGLLAAGVSPQARPLRAVGYREVVAVERGEAPLEGLRDRIFVSTWRYAKRQQTWFRAERDVCVLQEQSPSVAAVQALVDL